MELKQLSYFLAVSEAGSFSKAAVLLAVAQPILSRQIKLLETELGMDLLYRNGRGIVLSEAGKILDVHARTALQTVERARTEISALKAVPEGRIVIAMPPSIGWVLTGPLIRRCREAFPNIALHVVEGFSGHVAEWLSTGRVDVGIVYDASRRASLNTEPLFSDNLVLLGPANNPACLEGDTVAAARLADIPLILPAEPHGLRVLVDHVLAKIGATARVEFEVDAMPSTLGLVEEGLGYTVLSETAAAQRIGAGRIRAWAIVDPVITRQLILATSTQRPMSVATRLVTRLIRDQAASAFAKTPMGTAA
ncbi:MAG TPA: LysR substrate-binding domain-containing protein [Lichenihabitans sp.]|nr:LysR substrate-binding domain-containing protein [Lichenihabitans sp.]